MISRGGGVEGRGGVVVGLFVDADGLTFACVLGLIETRVGGFDELGAGHVRLVIEAVDAS